MQVVMLLLLEILNIIATSSKRDTIRAISTIIILSCGTMIVGILSGIAYKSFISILIGDNNLTWEATGWVARILFIAMPVLIGGYVTSALAVYTASWLSDIANANYRIAAYILSGVTAALGAVPIIIGAAQSNYAAGVPAACATLGFVLGLIVTSFWIKPRRRGDNIRQSDGAL